MIRNIFRKGEDHEKKRDSRNAYALSVSDRLCMEQKRGASQNKAHNLAGRGE